MLATDHEKTNPQPWRTQNQKSLEFSTYPACNLLTFSLKLGRSSLYLQH